MSLDGLGEVAKVFGVGAALCLVLAAAGYTALKVLRSDRTLSGIIERIEEERDYYRSLVTTERAEAAAERAELRRMLESADSTAKQERAAMTSHITSLIGEVEGLRRQLTAYTLKEKP